MPTTPLHIGIDATSWSNDRGFGRFTRELVTALAARDAGFRYTLLFDKTPDTELPNGVDIVTAETNRSINESAVGDQSRSLSYLWKVGQAARQAKFDVFFFPAVYSYFPFLARVPCIVCFHDTTAERLPEYLFPTKLNHWLWKAKTALARFQATRAMTVSNSSAADLENILGIPKQRIDVVSEAADPVFRVLDDPSAVGQARTNLGIPETANLLIYVGGLNAHKNILGLLRAMPAIVAENADTHLVIVGDTSGKGFWDNVDELKAFLKERPELEPRVHFTGYLSDEDLVHLLNSAACLVFPSLWEGFGLPAVEAMSCGVPVLASRLSSLPEVIGDAGLYFDPADPSDIAQCVIGFLNQPGVQEPLRAKALERAHSFTWERAAELAEQSFRRCYDDNSAR